MKLLRKKAGSPDQAFFPVLIAGTKGKGSTGFFLESILTAARIPNGFYSSPHLETPRERIRLNGKMISEKIWVDGMRQVQKVINRCPSREKFTYFEVMTLLAMIIFKKQGIKVGIFEAGMGGRLDATNVMDASLCILTPVHLDHEAVLGNTITKIAGEKAAIIRRRAHVVVSPQPEAALAVIKAFIRKQKAFYYSVEALRSKVGLGGDYQRVNAAAAAKTAELLRDVFHYDIRPGSLQKGLQAAQWPGRLEKVRRDGQLYLLDAAHNPISIEALVRNLEALYPRVSSRGLLVFGTSKDKNSDEMLRILSRYFEDIIVTRAAHSRSADAGMLLKRAQNRFKRIYPCANVQDAVSLASRLKRKLTVITGSFYLLGEAKKILSKKHQ